MGSSENAEVGSNRIYTRIQKDTHKRIYKDIQKSCSDRKCSSANLTEMME